MRALEFITGHVIYNSAYTYKFQLKTTLVKYSFHVATMLYFMMFFRIFATLVFAHWRINVAISLFIIQ